MSRVPVLAILGSTGSGKSRLGIELARRFSGEIISADSMQVYKGLDIITAKVTEQEKAMAPHHMLDIVDPLNPSFTVIDNLLAKKKLPIIVGGTNYYIESLLWQVLIAGAETDADVGQLNKKLEDATYRKKAKIELDRSTTKSNSELYEELTKVDPEMAMTIHENNRRKIIRSLEVFEQYGVTHSELLKAQRIAGGSDLGGPLRYPDSILLWLRCEQKVLDERLESRVDAMLETGLVQELLDFHRRYNEQRIKSNTSADYTKGIFQSIGFKEFHAYLVLPEEEKREKKGEKLLQQGIDDLKLVTKRYAKRQEKWIKNRLIRCADRQVPLLYELDCTDVNQWNSRVYEPAVAIIEAVMRGEKPEQKPLNELTLHQEYIKNNDKKRHYCDVCDRIFVGKFQWDIHLDSNKHKKVLKKKKIEERKKTEQSSASVDCKL
ncbi:unnamed protein product [Xylocopa violacea]|uniref:U1-type domain-containing protein n=1 Tax=Xylocopa violacea TaxID=135666 RepID=A0ABP1NK35_XYLVO